MVKITYFLLAVIILIGSVSALTIDKESLTNVIVPQYNQPARIDLLISNTSEGKYNVYTLTAVEIFPKETFEIISGVNRVELEIFPMQSLSSKGFYTFIYYLRDFKGINHEDKMTVKVVDLRDLIEISSEANYPGNQMSFYVKNKDNSRLKNLKASFESIFFEVEEEFNLEPFETKKFIVDVDPENIKKIPAGSYLLEANFNVDRGDGSIKGKIFFGESKEISTEETFSGFFIRSRSVKKINKGNTIETVQVEVSKNILSSSFTFFSEKPSRVDRKGLTNYYTWTKQINPSETVEIVSNTNYLVPLLIILIIFGAVYTLRKFNTTKLEVKKSVSHVKTKGGEFALRVRVNIKAHKNLENVSIIEKIPAIVKVHENFGALKPSSINLNERRLQWNLGNLQAGEERLFSYVIYSKVGVVGRFSLPESTAIFEENGNISETFSNKVFFLSEQVKRLE